MEAESTNDEVQIAPPSLATNAGDEDGRIAQLESLMLSMMRRERELALALAESEAHASALNADINGVFTGESL